MEYNMGFNIYSPGRHCMNGRCQFGTYNYSYRPEVISPPSVLTEDLINTLKARPIVHLYCHPRLAIPISETNALPNGYGYAKDVIRTVCPSRQKADFVFCPLQTWNINNPYIPVDVVHPVINNLVQRRNFKPLNGYITPHLAIVYLYNADYSPEHHVWKDRLDGMFYFIWEIDKNGRLTDYPESDFPFSTVDSAIWQNDNGVYCHNGTPWIMYCETASFCQCDETYIHRCPTTFTEEDYNDRTDKSRITLFYRMTNPYRIREMLRS